jgi:hypothetical protein
MGYLNLRIYLFGVTCAWAVYVAVAAYEARSFDVVFGLFLLGALVSWCRQSSRMLRRYGRDA